MHNYEEIKKTIEEQIEKLLSKEIEPRILFLGSYSYYLVKDRLERNGTKTGSAYAELHHIDISGFNLKIVLDRETILGGHHTEKSNTVRVFGD